MSVILKITNWLSDITNAAILSYLDISNPRKLPYVFLFNLETDTGLL